MTLVTEQSSPVQSEERQREAKERREAVERRRRAERAHVEWLMAAAAREKERQKEAGRTVAEKAAQEREVRQLGPGR